MMRLALPAALPLGLPLGLLALVLVSVSAQAQVAPKPPAMPTVTKPAVTKPAVTKPAAPEKPALASLPPLPAKLKTEGAKSAALQLKAAKPATSRGQDASEVSAKPDEAALLQQLMGKKSDLEKMISDAIKQGSKTSPAPVGALKDP